MQAAQGEAQQRAEQEQLQREQLQRERAQLQENLEREEASASRLREFQQQTAEESREAEQEAARQQEDQLQRAAEERSEAELAVGSSTSYSEHLESKEQRRDRLLAIPRTNPAYTPYTSVPVDRWTQEVPVALIEWDFDPDIIDRLNDDIPNASE